MTTYFVDIRHTAAGSYFFLFKNLSNMIESIKIDIGLVVGDSDDCDFCCPFIRNKEPFKRALVSILM